MKTKRFLRLLFSFLLLLLLLQTYRENGVFKRPDFFTTVGGGKREKKKNTNQMEYIDMYIEKDEKCGSMRLHVVVTADYVCVCVL